MRPRIITQACGPYRVAWYGGFYVWLFDNRSRIAINMMNVGYGYEPHDTVRRLCDDIPDRKQHIIQDSKRMTF